MTTSESIPSRPSHAILDMLNTSFKVFHDCQPLALGVHEVIKERLPDIDTQQLRLAMRIHTASSRYLKVLSQAETRFDLDGSPEGEVTAEQRDLASATLRMRFGKRAERYKMKMLAKQLAEKQSQFKKERQNKLLKLAEKFNTR